MKTIATSAFAVALPSALTLMVGLELGWGGWALVWGGWALKLSVPIQTRTKSNKTHILFMSKPPAEIVGCYRNL
jgi:hypothetical protein